MDYIPQQKSVLPTFSQPPVGKEKGGASSVDAALREDTVISQAVEEENRQVLEPLPLDLLWQILMREQDRIPHQFPQGGQNPLPKQGSGYDLLPCHFCRQQQHPARSCPQYIKPDTVYLKAVEALLCLNCLRVGHFASSCPHPGCSMEGCNARHHKLLHGHTNPTRKNL